MMWLLKRNSDKDKANPYVTREYFRKVFAEDRADLYRLSLLLTGDHEAAEQCFVGGLEDSVNSNRVFKEWAHTWAKRAILQNAIRALKPRPRQQAMSIVAEHVVEIGASLPSIPDGGPAISSVLALEVFERFVFVITVLEAHSEHECALLLNASLRDVRNARIRATEQVAPAESSPKTAAYSSTGGRVDYAAGFVIGGAAC
jgi:hypothetical protein